MTLDKTPNWIVRLDKEDINFIKKFILASGSLKEIAAIYDVSYPTVRLRLDRLIQKIHISDTHKEEPFVSLIKELTIEDKMDYSTAKLLIHSYRKSKEEGE